MKVYIAVETECDNAAVKIRVAGLLDEDGTRLLKKTFHKLLKEENQSRFEIDLAEVSYISEEAARFLCELKSERQITLAAPQFLTLAMIESFKNS